jgi:hypothetical protein
MEKNSMYNPFSKKNNVNTVNTVNTVNVSSASSASNIKIILISAAILIIICISIYLIICIVHFNKIECYEKKNFFEYMFDFSNNEVCIQETEPVPILPKPLPPTTPHVDLLSIIENKKEVFHIANQDYTYEQSKCKCESYGGRLATKAEIVDAYNNGAHWCTYGWTEKQTAYYPVQQCEWDKIKEINDRLPTDQQNKYCGIPGINGGYFANPHLKFGINCYGVKPKGELNKANKPYCPPMNFCKLDNNYEASHKLDTDEISGFNNDKWNMN